MRGRGSLPPARRAHAAQIRLEKEATKTLGQICSEGGKAITVHSVRPRRPPARAPPAPRALVHGPPHPPQSHRDASKKEAEDCKLEAFRLKDRAQKVAYRLNGLALDTF